MRSESGLPETLAAFERVVEAAREAVKPALEKSGEEMANAMRFAAMPSRATGKLIESIAVTLPGETTPPYSQPGGSRVAGPFEAIVTAGNKDVRYAHLVEYGTSKAEAQPYFWPVYRLLKARATRRITRAINKSIKEAFDA
ncbi:HK97-gp10 family putative phage morphogenesis protein [Pararhizobium mangrovi]|uniref:HK97 gp10 family phage protein n=1 Tax=Pararhizobium mangrovi TaxID=2590452 RepID=A0A506U199_9HYPH|nr:HK97-gp10 family putative phage morphogenesis protein [Pararhizobium mangrovi]TPW26389.1 HK97 gp10 family phage protein [Pararhizobium mangrovi]